MPFPQTLPISAVHAQTAPHPMSHPMSHTGLNITPALPHLDLWSPVWALVRLRFAFATALIGQIPAAFLIVPTVLAILALVLDWSSGWKFGVREVLVRAAAWLVQIGLRFVFSFNGR